MVDRQFLSENGFFRCVGLIPKPDLETLSSEVDELIRRWEGGDAAEDRRFWSFRRDESLILYRIHDLETLIPSANAILSRPPILTLRDAILGKHSRTTAFAAIIKRPFLAAPVPWHRDPIKAMPGTIFNLSLFLDESTPENGCLSLVPGSHLTDQAVPSDDSEPAGAMPVPASAGDVVVHDVRIIHGSGGNRSPAGRRSIVVEVQPAV